MDVTVHYSVKPVSHYTLTLQPNEAEQLLSELRDVKARGGPRVYALFTRLQEVLSPKIGKLAASSIGSET